MMKNKRVKQMICDVWEHCAESGVRGVYGYHFGICLIPPTYEQETKYCLCFDGYEMKCGVVSVTANKLIELSGGSITKRAIKWLNQPCQRTHGKSKK